MKSQIFEACHINSRVNLILIDAISDEGFECTLSKQGGRNVALQFSHIHYVRLYRLERFAKDLMKDQTKIKTETKITRIMLKKRLNESADALAEFIEGGVNDAGNIKGFKRGVIPMLGYLISHEAHHRGSILLTLKTCDHPLPKEIRERIWAWNRI